jgi:hypothetical protein
LGEPLKVLEKHVLNPSLEGGERDNVSFIGKSSLKFDLKNIFLTYVNGISWKK